MRIITGKFKGRILNTVKDNGVRPATDHVKGTIFNVLQNRLRVEGARVLDLFAGSGSLGFEALSRGADHVVFVDDRKEVLDVIERNAAMLDCVDTCEIMQSDALAFIRCEHSQYDLIFADPPYAFEDLPAIPELVFSHKLLKKEGFLIIEHSKHTTFPINNSYRVVVNKEFGNTRVNFFTHRETGEAIA